MKNPLNHTAVRIPIRESEIDRACPDESVQGELYLYHCEDSRCPSEDSLWGVFDREESGRIRLETSSLDLIEFRFWHALPPEYRYSRRATREELRDYTAGLAFYECRNHGSLPAALRPLPGSK